MPKYQVKQSGIVNHRRREKLEVIELSEYVAGFYKDNLTQVAADTKTGFYKEKVAKSGKDVVLEKNGAQITKKLEENDALDKNKVAKSEEKKEKSKNNIKNDVNDAEDEEQQTDIETEAEE